MIGGKLGKARSRPDLLGKQSPPGLEVIQLTSETAVPSSHLYMEAQIFTMDSKRGSSSIARPGPTAEARTTPSNQYLLCDIENGCTLQPLTDELGVTAASVSPDGKFLYYFVDATRVGGGRLTLKRVGLDGSDSADPGGSSTGRFPAPCSGPATSIRCRRSRPTAAAWHCRRCTATASRSRPPMA